MRLWLTLPLPLRPLYGKTRAAPLQALRCSSSHRSNIHSAGLPGIRAGSEQIHTRTNARFVPKTTFTFPPVTRSTVSPSIDKQLCVAPTLTGTAAITDRGDKIAAIERLGHHINIERREIVSVFGDGCGVARTQHDWDLLGIRVGLKMNDKDPAARGGATKMIQQNEIGLEIANGWNLWQCRQRDQLESFALQNLAVQGAHSRIFV
jgi:hypothetical protein